MMSKGLTTREIVLLIAGFLILGLMIYLAWLVFGPGRETATYGECRARVLMWCTDKDPARWDIVVGDMCKDYFVESEFTSDPNTKCSELLAA